MEFGKLLSIISLLITFFGLLVSASFLSLDKLSFESMVWITFGGLFIVIVITYGELRRELKEIKSNQKTSDKKFKLEQKKSDEKFKIYDRLAKIEEMIKNGS